MVHGTTALYLWPLDVSELSFTGGIIRDFQAVHVILVPQEDTPNEMRKNRFLHSILFGSVLCHRMS